ncbi:hypothetical protein [Spongiimicrobium salis]|uniref:hypothetical protein n=1 Tax=Spongiimicrobium salis TaxID=1667022 RepID=UPI00374CB8C6
MADNKENPFKVMQSSLKEVPAHMRKKVMHDVAIAKFFMEMGTLFTTNFKSVLEGMFKSNKRSEQNN